MTQENARKQIALFYGSSTCYTEIAAEKICTAIGQQRVDILNVADTPIIEAQFYDYVIMGIPTWDYGELQEDWEEIWDEIDELDLRGKQVALFGLGDQIGYPEWFLDAMGYLHHKLKERGAKFVGYWKNSGYEFEASKGLTPDAKHFLGLALDEENEFTKTDERIKLWCAQIIKEFGLSAE
ncbi:MAG: flavodoxin II [Lentisphaeria bacterium]|jgi:flavodoxin II